MSESGRAFLAEDLKVDSREAAAVNGGAVMLEGLAVGGGGKAVAEAGVGEEFGERIG